MTDSCLALTITLSPNKSIYFGAVLSVKHQQLVCLPRLDSIVVDYAVTVGVDGAGVSLEQLNYLTLQSNRVENSYREIQERSTTVYSIGEVKNVFSGKMTASSYLIVFQNLLCRLTRFMFL